ncbi:alpha-amylase-like [Haliotis rufescens]|uniref:alpha-amylase-like n=1 Tax=Haliotis rufescens TaxID=6454 RepID=UPI00201EEA4F|nr:alpha-amylase-like [Haliotis rufescens]
MATIWFLTFILHTALGSMYSDPNCVEGRSTITHLFEWRWADIAAECERFLGPYGYCGVQISPPHENRVINNPMRPWWERYQPISFKLQTRSGTEQDLKDMVARCNKVGVRIYGDSVINHMASAASSGVGTSGSTYNGTALQFPGVPFGPSDFNDDATCHSPDMSIHDFNNVEEVRNCRLFDLVDLQLDKTSVRVKIVAYLNHLIDMGFAGFRLDAAKHMWPGDILAIMDQVNNLRSEVFGHNKRPFVFQEVIDRAVPEPITGDQYLSSGRVTNFIYGAEITKYFRKQKAMKLLINLVTGMMRSDDTIIFIDNQDTQRDHGDHGAPGDVLSHFEPRAYKMATAFMLAFPYGFAKVMSSYDFPLTDSDQGPPHNNDMTIKSVSINSDMSCGNGWTCEHRWRPMYNMVAFKNVAYGSELTNWWSGSDYQIAFSRGNKAFIAFNLEGADLQQTLNTGLPSGDYCDVISGNLENGNCTGHTVHVDADGHAPIHVGGSDQDPMVAIHVGAKVGSPMRRVG